MCVCVFVSGERRRRVGFFATAQRLVITAPVLIGASSSYDTLGGWVE